MAIIKRSTKSNVFQSEMVHSTGIEKWKEGRWWREFLVSVSYPPYNCLICLTFKDERRRFFSKIEISAKPKETERVALEALFKDWVKTSDEWWGGDWVEQPGLADWHVSQHLRARKLSEPGKNPQTPPRGCRC